MHEALEPLLAASSAISHSADRRRILVLNDFPVGSAAAGGEVRIARLLAALAQWHDVTLLCLTDEIGASDRRVAPGFREIAIPKTEEHRALQQAWNDRNPVSVSDIVSAAMCSKNAALVELYATSRRGSRRGRAGASLSGAAAADVGATASRDLRSVQRRKRLEGRDARAAPRSGHAGRDR